MPKINIAVPHNLGEKEATERIKKLIPDLQAKYGSMIENVKENWTGNRADFGFEAMGFTISGKLQIQPAEVLLEATIPLAAVPFRGRIESAIQDGARRLLS